VLRVTLNSEDVCIIVAMSNANCNAEDVSRILKEFLAETPNASCLSESGLRAAMISFLDAKESKNPNHTSLNENYVVPCICLRAIWHMHGSMWRAMLENVARIPLRDTSNHAYAIALRHTWNDVILVKRSMIRVFSLPRSFKPRYGPEVDWASNRNQYQKYFMGVKAAGI